MRSGGFLKKRDARSGMSRDVLRPGPMPNPFVVEDALPRLEPVDGHCAACGSRLVVGAAGCAVCGRSAGPHIAPAPSAPLDLPQRPPDAQAGSDGSLIAVTTARPISVACIRFAAWVWADAAFCHFCGAPSIGALPETPELPAGPPVPGLR